MPKTGQKKCYDVNGQEINNCNNTGQDGELQKGVDWPSPRFTVNTNGSNQDDGTVTDKLTGLIWLKDAKVIGSKKWEEALKAVKTLANGEHELSDGSSAGEWRLPNVRELCSLIDYGLSSPALPEDHPFDNVQSDSYWSSTTYTFNTAHGLVVYLNSSVTVNDCKSSLNYVWPVRDK